MPERQKIRRNHETYRGGIAPLDNLKNVFHKNDFFFFLIGCIHSCFPTVLILYHLHSVLSYYRSILSAKTRSPQSAI